MLFITYSMLIAISQTFYMKTHELKYPHFHKLINGFNSTHQNPAYYHLYFMLEKQMVNIHPKMHNMERGNK